MEELACIRLSCGNVRLQYISGWIFLNKVTAFIYKVAIVKTKSATTAFSSFSPPPPPSLSFFLYPLFQLPSDFQAFGTEKTHVLGFFAHFVQTARCRCG